MANSFRITITTPADPNTIPPTPAGLITVNFPKLQRAYETYDMMTSILLPTLPVDSAINIYVVKDNGNSIDIDTNKRKPDPVVP